MKKSDKNESVDIEHATTQDLLAELARRRAGLVLGDMTAMELGLEAVGADLKSASTEQFLQEHSRNEDNSAKPCPRCGKKVRVKAKRRERKVRSLSGMHSLARNYHYCTICRFGFYPLDEKLGLPVEGEVTAELEKRILDFGVNDTFSSAAERWEIHYAIPISENQVRCVVDRVGRMAAGANEVHLQNELDAPPQQLPRMLVIEADGGMLPTRGKDPWREAKLGVVVRGEHYVRGHQKQRGMVSQGRYVAHLGGVEEFKMRLDAALELERADQVRKVAWVSDGAPWIWNMADAICPNAIQILDWPHALEHVSKCGKLVLGQEDPMLELWTKCATDLLWNGHVGELISELEACLFLSRGPKRKAIVDLIRYCKNNRKRMNYASFLEQELPIGSGIIESAHKHVLQVRMKRAGQHWDPIRADRMATLRAAYRTAGANNLYPAIRRATDKSRSLAA
jgi:hypothetical protein|tara:strand:+ start:54 stop:1412 length:1359 start_codon:yes stop_codon:yes gene_type:complete